MTKLHYVKKARKTYPKTGVKKGMPYYWWKFPRSPRRISVTKPRRSQLTKSEYLATMYDIEDDFTDETDPNEDTLNDYASRIEDMRSELEEKISSIESAFPNGCPTLDLLNERVEMLTALYESLTSAASKLDEESSSEDREAIISSINWEY